MTLESRTFFSSQIFHSSLKTFYHHCHKGGQYFYPEIQQKRRGIPAPLIMPQSKDSYAFTSGSTFRNRICNSRNCFSSTSDGARVSRHCARWVFGNAITSRIDSAPVIIVTMRSRPNAKPPCGGAPYCKASSRKPNFSCASSAPIFNARNTLL